MPRTIVYQSRPVNQHYAAAYASRRAEGNAVSRAPASSASRDIVRDAVQRAARGEAVAAAAEVPDRDDLLARIAKYVPAELITLTTLGFAAFPPDGNTIWIYVAMGAALNLVYLFGTALTTESTTPRPRAWFYLLSVGAFAGWAFATLDEVQKKAGLTGDSATTKQGFHPAGHRDLRPNVGCDAQPPRDLGLAAPSRGDNPHFDPEERHDARDPEPSDRGHG